MTQHLLQAFEAEQIRQLSEGKTLDSFDAGDTVRVHVKIVEGTNERIQVYEGVVIGKRNRGLHSSFTVRKISHGTGIERNFMLYSPRVARIERIRRGHVRRAKLYYLRERSGKATRIREKRDVIPTEA